MALTPGTRLGRYQISALIGEGGMGEVYKASDTNLKRAVAIKVLPAAVAADVERLARFQREAEVLAALNHANIAQIHGLDKSAGVIALVMELVEGPTLADRLAQGAIPPDDALPVAKQIAEALEAAHAQGIIHRDLKPANIKVRTDGTVKVLDFGLAKALDPAGTSSASASMSPTITSPAMTHAGMILGTAAYMAPEQARGKVVDKRADIWAFGAVLFEMLTGRRAFPGEDVTDTLAAVVRGEPDWTLLPSSVSPTLVLFLRRCLQKDPKQRVGDIHDVRLALDGAFDVAASHAIAPASPPARNSRLAWIVAGTAVFAAAALAIPAVRHFGEAPPEAPTFQLSIPLPANTTHGFLELSPDGSRMVVALNRDGKAHLYLRPLQSTDLQQLRGTDNARAPFWSADSRFIGFFADGMLRVIPAAGGPTRPLCTETGLGSGGTWNAAGVILFATERGLLRRVDANGGSCTAVGKDDPLRPVRFPVFLPDGDNFLYASAPPGDAASRGVYLASLTDPTARAILADYSSVVYAPPLSGGLAHLLFLRDTTLMAQPFDAVARQPVGDPFPVAAGASTTPTPPQVAASVSGTTLVYASGRSRESQLTWFDRSGHVVGRVGPPAEHQGLALSPDGTSVLTGHRESSGQTARWLYDLVRKSESRFLPADTPSGNPVWWPDASRVLFVSPGASTGRGLYQKGTSGGEPELMLSLAADVTFNPSMVSRDGRFLVSTVVDPKTQADIAYLPWDAKPDLGNAVKLVATAAIDSQGQVSPNGQWLAYTSNETGAYEVYARPFPGGSGVSKVDQGREPRWSADGKQLYYIQIANAMDAVLMAVSVDVDGRGGLRLGTPTKLFNFRAPIFVPQGNTFSYHPHPDGQRFLVNALTGDEEPVLNVITNWQKTVEGRTGQ